MRLFLLLSLLFLPSAKAASWISIEPDHFNLLYSEGESASILFRILSQPSNPDYQMEISVAPEGESPEAPAIENGQAVYQSAPLAVGNKSFAVTIRIVGPGGYSQVVQENSLNLIVQPVSESR